MPHFTLFPTAIGDCGIAWRGESVVATGLPGPELGARFKARWAATEAEPPPAIARAIAAIQALLNGEKSDLNFIACDVEGVEPFAVEVYAATRAIPPGETRTYGEFAARLGDKQWAQRVGQALGRNPFPIIVPCHRVMGANGKLTGFSAPGGVETKLKLLAIEGAKLGASGLFDDLPLAAKPQQ